MNTIQPQPTITGVLIQTSPAEVVQAPSKQAAPAQPESVQPQLKTKRKFKLKSQPDAKPRQIAENVISHKPLQQKQTDTPKQYVPSTPATNELDSLGAPVTLPQVDASRLNNPAPAYPIASRRRGEAGTVVLEVLIMPDGSVAEVRIKHSSGYPRLDKSALTAVKRWHYMPAKQNGVPIQYSYLQPVNFALRKRI
ncbi:MAG: energy transducer TonB [Gammaproteobacteria bacterium]